jgi:hypothetical protein
VNKNVISAHKLGITRFFRMQVTDGNLHNFTHVVIKPCHVMLNRCPITASNLDQLKQGAQKIRFLAPYFIM